MKPIRQDRYQVGDKVEFDFDFVNSDGMFKDCYLDFIARYPNGPYEVLEVKDSSTPQYSCHIQHLTLGEDEVWSGAWFKPIEREKGLGDVLQDILTRRDNVINQWDDPVDFVD